MTNRANRIMWTVIGALLAIAGGAIILANRGALPGVETSAVLLPVSAIQRWHDLGPWGPTTVVIAGLVVALLGVRLFLAQTRRRSQPALPDLRLRAGGPAATDLPADSPDSARPVVRGEVTVAARVLARSLEHDLARDRHIRHAAVSLTGHAPDPDVWVRLDIAGSADVPELGERVTAALDRFATTSGLTPRRVDITAKTASAGRYTPR
ncbi:hypothetical protein [Pilimelia columellifera]|uniref:Alkaline shock response membrane anchor protein AmaP n=1 Tax=Pilimelia columellifera subsp. columellifera TaxID=706583 RepID=A0ABP6AZV8_9ACTN